MVCLFRKNGVLERIKRADNALQEIISLALYYDMNVLDDAEFLLLYDFYNPRNLDLPCELYPHFDLQNLTEDKCLSEFRFKKADIPRLSQALRIPDVISCHQGTICDGTKGLCMLLKRLCYPCRYSDMVHLFAKPVPVLCMITNQVLDYIYQVHSHRILQWTHQLLSQVKQKDSQPQSSRVICNKKLSSTCEEFKFRGWYDAVFRLGQETHQILFEFQQTR